MAAVIARIGRGYARMWRAVKKPFSRGTYGGWPSPPADDTHAYYRTQYERLVGVLPTLPRGQSHPRASERKTTLLAFAQILEGLHNYGDDPIMPPGVRRVIVRE